MIKVTVGIVPGGHAECRRMIGLMQIANISDLGPRCDCRVDLTEAENPLTARKASACTVYVRDHDRNQSVWLLIAAALVVVKDAEFYRNSE
jgi:hypothetical protein